MPYCNLELTNHKQRWDKGKGILVGASLSEPHTSMTALRRCVCMLACLHACGHIPYILNEHI